MALNLHAKLKKAHALREELRLGRVREAILHELFAGMPPDEFALLADLPITRYVQADLDGIRRDAAVTVQRARAEQARLERSKAEVRAHSESAAEALSRALDEPVYCISATTSGWAARTPVDPAAHAVLVGAFADCLAPEELCPPFAPRVAMEVRVAHHGAPRTHLVVHMRAEPGVLHADVCVFDFPSMRVPPFVSTVPAARDALLHRIVRALAQAAAAPPDVLAAQIELRVYPPGELE